MNTTSYCLKSFGIFEYSSGEKIALSVQNNGGHCIRQQMVQEHLIMKFGIHL